MLNKIVVLFLLMSSFTEANATPAFGRSPAGPGVDPCYSFGSPYHCNNTNECHWNFQANLCEWRGMGGGNWGGGNNYGQCQFINNYDQCVNTQGCSWDRGRCFFPSGGQTPWRTCEYLSYYDCSHTSHCYWHSFTNRCENIRGHRGDFPQSCSSIYDYRRCSAVPNCYWNPVRSNCESARI